jgi:hypothetical protein
MVTPNVFGQSSTPNVVVVVAIVVVVIVVGGSGEPTQELDDRE